MMTGLTALQKYKTLWSSEETKPSHCSDSHQEHSLYTSSYWLLLSSCNIVIVVLLFSDTMFLLFAVCAFAADSYMLMSIISHFSLKNKYKQLQKK